MLVLVSKFNIPILGKNYNELIFIFYLYSDDLQYFRIKYKKKLNVIYVSRIYADSRIITTTNNYILLTKVEYRQQDSRISWLNECTELCVQNSDL